MNRISYLLKDINKSQRELSKIVKIDICTMSNLISGKQPFREIHIEKLTHYFQVSSDFLLGKTDTGIYACDENGQDIILSKDDYETIRDKITVFADLGDNKNVDIVTVNGRNPIQFGGSFVFRVVDSEFLDACPKTRLISLINDMKTDEINDTLEFVDRFILNKRK